MEMAMSVGADKALLETLAERMDSKFEFLKKIKLWKRAF